MNPAPSIRHSGRYNTRLSIVLLDIDHFKRINDTYGHAAGDRVLEETASLLMRSVRQADSVGRYGGEEFLIILPSTDIKGATVIAERIRKMVESSPRHIDDTATVPVTISLGVTQWRDDDSGDSLLARPLQEMYQGLYFPIPPSVESFLVPKGDAEIRLELHCELFDIRTAKHWTPKEPS